MSFTPSTPLANVVGLAVLASSRLSKPRCNNGGIGFPARHTLGVYGAPETGAAHARQEAPNPRPPGHHGGRPPKRGTRLGGRRRHAAHAPAARRLTMSPGESEVAEAHCPASPPPPPRRGLLSWGVPPAAGMVGPEDPRPKSLQSWREGWGLLWAVSSITCDHCFEAPGSQAHQAIRGPFPVEDLLKGVI
jgi:hypothetical protein